MDKQSRRDIARAYKERKVPVGIFSLRCARTGETWIGLSRNLDGAANSAQLGLRMGSHRNKAIPEAITAKAAKLAYDGERIRHWVLHLWHQELALEAYFAKSGLAVEVLDYDELTRDPDAVVGRIADACGGERPSTLRSEFAKVRGSRSNVLAAEFVADPKSRASLAKLGIPEARLTGE